MGNYCVGVRIAMRRVFIGMACVALSSCAVVPELPPEEQVKIADIVRTVKCELHDAVVQSLKNKSERPSSGADFSFKDWVAGVQLTMKVQEGAGASADMAFVVPIHLGTFTIGFNGGVAGKATATSQFFFATSLNEVKSYPCGAPTGERAGMTLTGDLGLKEWVARVVDAINTSGLKNSEFPDEKSARIGYRVDFVLTVSGGVTPKFSIVRLDKHQQSGSANGSASHENTNTLEIVMVPKSFDAGEGKSGRSRNKSEGRIGGFGEKSDSSSTVKRIERAIDTLQGY